MSNHFHLVVYYDLLACRDWDDAEVARRWTGAFPPRVSPDYPQDLEALQEIRREALLQDPVQLKRKRLALGNLSTFMQHLKQPIAWKANREDKCTGHFFEKRFYSGALLSEKAVLATMAMLISIRCGLRSAKTLKVMNIHRSTGDWLTMRIQLKNCTRHCNL